jgi:hypothetical protein
MKSRTGIPACLLELLGRDVYRTSDIQSISSLQRSDEFNSSAQETEERGQAHLPHRELISVEIVISP